MDSIRAARLDYLIKARLLPFESATSVHDDDEWQIVKIQSTTLYVHFSLADTWELEVSTRDVGGLLLAVKVRWPSPESLARSAGCEYLDACDLFA